MKNNDTLCRKLGYTFQNPALLKAALTHRSIRGDNNERLEFLGDAILNFVIASAVFHQCPYATEGELSRLRASLVKGETLAILAKEFELGEYLHLGPGELKSGGARRSSILADAMEAVIAAIYLDSHMKMEICQARVLAWYASRLEKLSQLLGQKDPKSCLQEYLQARKIHPPIYTVSLVEGEAHQQTFRVECRVESMKHVTKGTGSSRRNAEQDAAQQYMEWLELTHD